METVWDGSFAMDVRKSFLHSSAGRFADIGLRFIGVVIIARLLSPHEIGIFAVAMSALIVAQTFREFGLGAYLIQEKDLTEEKIRTTFGIAFLVSWALAACLAFSSGLVAEFYREPAMREVLWVLALNFVLIPLGAPSLALLQREMRFGELAFVNVSASLVQLVVAVLLALWGASYMSLAWAAVVRVLVTVAILIAIRAPHVLIRPSLTEWRVIFHFGSLSAITALVTQIGMVLPDLVLGRMLGFTAVAYYSRASRIIGIFRTGIMSALFGVLQSSFAISNRTDPARIKPDFLKATEMLTGLAWPFFLFAGAFSSPVIEFLFGNQWSASAPVLQVLCLATSVFYLMANAGPLIIGMGLVRQRLYIETTLQSARLGMVLFAVQYGLVAVAWAQVFTYVFYVVMLLYVLGGRFNIAWQDIYQAVRKSLLITIICCTTPLIGLSIFDFDGASLFWELPLCGMFFCVNWLIAAKLTKHPVLDEVKLALLSLNSLTLKI